MFKKLFGKKEKNQIKEEVLAAPATGKVVPLDQVPDPVFAEKMMGDGLAIDPSEGVIAAPADAEVLQVFPTKHAVGLKTATGAEILIHIGLETVSMNGEGFETHVSAGDKVKKGQKLVSFDLNLIREKAKSTITPIIVTNGDSFEELDKTSETQAVLGETNLITLKVK
ncbi:PTS system glucose-specific IIA component [Peribacillus deserti]|uniref:PTS system glucose-specific IIA component n=1 Tax=Peribacillus deserti TaxID=673318 RepID=A0ABS2QIA3_9BACI|nr:PTS glucose transporter subunit IIA [Peribacillus deserti]MBM7692534.1 PTS system glucose-specific IIA component [Peribacillus deserti]